MFKKQRFVTKSLCRKGQRPIAGSRPETVLRVRVQPLWGRGLNGYFCTGRFSICLFVPVNTHRLTHSNLEIETFAADSFARFEGQSNVRFEIKIFALTYQHKDVTKQFPVRLRVLMGPTPPWNPNALPSCLESHPCDSKQCTLSWSSETERISWARQNRPNFR